jgi:hypothetical protein
MNISRLVLVGALLIASTVSPGVLPRAPDCPVFPATNVWNKKVNDLPVRSDSARLIRAIGMEDGLHPDFGSKRIYGIPYNVVDSTTPKVHVQFSYADESDSGPYPIPLHPKIETGNDHHILIVNRDDCTLYEIYDAQKIDGQWFGGAGAVWDLRSNKLRPKGWTSADAAGLPMLPGLVRHHEVVHGMIDHALRFTAPVTRTSHVYPARHDAGDSSSRSLPPMGLRVRLKASVDISHFSSANRVILTALKEYGMYLADNGSPWFVTGVPDKRWNDDDLHELNRITGRDFEAVNTRHFRNGP